MGFSLPTLKKRKFKKKRRKGKKKKKAQQYLLCRDTSPRHTPTHPHTPQKRRGINLRNKCSRLAGE